MATVKLKFSKINRSLQVGDIAFYIDTQTSGAYTINNGEGEKLGVVRKITEESDGTFTIQVDIPNNVATPTTTDYVYFAKNTKANYSGVKGYYAEIKMTNNKTSKAELFSLSSEVVESSK